MAITAGSTDVTLEVGPVFADDGTLKTDIAHSTSGLSIKVQVGNGSITTLSPASMSAGTHADGGIYHVGGGRYRVGLTDVLVASAASELVAWLELSGFECLPGKTSVVATVVSPPTAAAIRQEMDSNSTKLASIEGDTQDIQSRLPAALVGGKMDAVAEVGGEVTVASSSLSAIADAVWDEPTSGHATSGTFGKAVSDLPSAAQTASELLGTVIVNSLSFRQLLQYMAAESLGALSITDNGDQTYTLEFTDAGGSVTRITSVCDSQGQRTSQTLEAI